jgi:hypothetical protein
MNSLLEYEFIIDINIKLVSGKACHLEIKMGTHLEIGERRKYLKNPEIWRELPPNPKT